MYIEFFVSPLQPTMNAPQVPDHVQFLVVSCNVIIRVGVSNIITCSYV